MGTETVTSGFVAVTGRPNVGKSSLVNRLVGETVSIATETPRTTRYRTRGILNRPDAQIVLTDTPAVHEPTGPLADRLVRRAGEGWKDADLVVLVVDAVDGFTDGDRLVLDRLENPDRPILLAPGKLDRVNAGPGEIVESMEGEGPWTDLVPVSAKTGAGTDDLVSTIEERLPEGPRFFPRDRATDRSREFRASEMIRAEAINRTHEEVPHSVAVVPRTIKPGEDPEITVVEATVYVERESQKGILIGEGGRNIKAIGQNARPKLEELLDGKVYLDLSVEVLENWTEVPDKIEQVGELKGRTNP